LRAAVQPVPEAKLEQGITVVALSDLAATEALAARLAPCLRPGDLLALWGDLGVGKTAFARALIRGATGRPDEEVPSPSFTLLQSYDSGLGAIHHFDLYRLRHPDELVELGWDDAMVGGIVLVEWPGHAGSLLPGGRLDLTLAPGREERGRTATIRPLGGWGDDNPTFVALQRELRGE
jgi:tRNA threonylcarbamoyladenosine biosynthesis protein TsaE